MSEEIKETKKETPASETQVPAEEVKKEEEVNPYQAELAKMKGDSERKETQLSQAEYNIQQLKKEKKELEEKILEQTNSKEEFDPSKVQELVQQEADKIRGEITSGRRSELISKMSDDTNERELMEYILENKIKPSGDLVQDIADAKILANKNRIQENFKELQFSYDSKSSKSTGTPSSQLVNSKDETEPNLSSKDQAFMRQANTWSSKK